MKGMNVDQIAGEFYSSAKRFVDVEEELDACLEEKTAAKGKIQELKKELTLCVRKMEMELKLVHNYKRRKEYTQLRRMKKRKEEYEEKINMMELFGNEASDDYDGDEDGPLLGNHSGNADLKVLRNIQMLAGGVLQRETAINMNLHQDTEGLKRAIDTNYKIGNTLQGTGVYIRGIMRTDLYRRLSLFLVALILAIIDIWVFYSKFLS